jgi:sporadic carbohydrate cluster protein (TIGR04323 family)
MSERQGYRGYVTSREFGGLRIPVPVQSLVLRDYCARKKLLYKLHVNENMFPHSYLVLEGLVRGLSELQGILMCSMYMLPRRASRRRQLYRQILDQGADVHFVLEDVAICKSADIEPVEDILAAVNWLAQSPARIPDELIGPGH